MSLYGVNVGGGGGICGAAEGVYRGSEGVYVSFSVGRFSNDGPVWKSLTKNSTALHQHC